MRPKFHGLFHEIDLTPEELAERVGFEPTVPRKAHNGFRGRPSSDGEIAEIRLSSAKSIVSAIDGRSYEPGRGYDP